MYGSGSTSPIKAKKDLQLSRHSKRKLEKKKSATNQKNAGHPIVAFSVLKIIELIHEDYPNLDVSNEGEADFIIEYKEHPDEATWISRLKTILLSIVIFFGASFSIMAFNNDIGITEVFGKFYEQVMGSKSTGVTEIEICYSIGLAVGITVFFNHFGKKKITHDPTPLQVEMRKYEEDIDTTFIENAERKGHSVDVD